MDRHHPILADLDGKRTQSFEEGAGLGGVETKSFDVGQATARCMTTGGGRGALHFVDGDYPTAALRGIKTQQNSQSSVKTQIQNSEHDINNENYKNTFIIFGKNIQSIQTEARVQELFAELETMQHWDAVLLNETWRELKEEHFETKEGHLFMAAGCTKGQKALLCYCARDGGMHC